VDPVRLARNKTGAKICALQDDAAVYVIRHQSGSLGPVDMRGTKPNVFSRGSAALSPGRASFPALGRGVGASGRSGGRRTGT